MEAPKLPSFIKQNRHKSFDFKPRYYSERKERLEEIKRKYEKELSPEAKNASLRQNLNSTWQDARQTKVNSSNRMLLFIILGLISITYYIIKY